MEKVLDLSPTLELDMSDHAQIAIRLYCLKHAGRLTNDELRSICSRNGIDDVQDHPDLSERSFGSEFLYLLARQLHRADVLTRTEFNIIAQDRDGHDYE
jgi:hypothetical protein